MTTELHNLRPSTRIGAIYPEILRGLPLGGIYIYASDDFEAVMRINRWSGDLPRCSAWGLNGEGWIESGEARTGDFFYPQLPALSFKLTPDQISDRSKTVTRRKNIPKWAQPGRLFMAWDRSFRGGKGKARGLGVFRIVSADRQAWTVRCCTACPYTEQGATWSFCPVCSEHGLTEFNITREELEAEGFPKMNRQDFWALLKKAGNVRDDGTVARIQFEPV